jgi:hypothetical protein
VHDDGSFTVLWSVLDDLFGRRYDSPSAQQRGRSYSSRRPWTAARRTWHHGSSRRASRNGCLDTAPQAACSHDDTDEAAQLTRDRDNGDVRMLALDQSPESLAESVLHLERHHGGPISFLRIQRRQRLTVDNLGYARVLARSTTQTSGQPSSNPGFATGEPTVWKTPLPAVAVAHDVA